ncbi:beta-phosphoglucomutase [Enterococcus devriesei]|uniref:Beta-phosphoglucomutase n=1 Tax=Enterococcus devriesei TaxID=319970 RepID=A0A1L8SVN4_9ENTE|nr:beta-phosphoglucomutase [Enterococcus devriesei]
MIADTSTLHFDAWQSLAHNHFSADLPMQLEERTKGVSRRDSLKVILNHLNLSISSNEFQHLLNEKNELYKASLKDLTPKNILPGVAEFISELKGRKVKLALASASLNGPVILEKLALSEAFDTIIDPSTIPLGKPAPDIFIAAAKSLSLFPTDCIGIEDSVAGVNAINASGALAISVGTNKALKSTSHNFGTTAELNLADIHLAYQIFKKELFG